MKQQAGGQGIPPIAMSGERSSQADTEHKIKGRPAMNTPLTPLARQDFLVPCEVKLSNHGTSSSVYLFDWAKSF
jgi:hypothetical protein